MSIHLYTCSIKKVNMKSLAPLFILSVVGLMVPNFGLAQEADSAKTWSLQDCINYAVEKNLTVIDATYDEQSAQLEYKQSKNNRLPNLTGSASQSLTNGTSIDPITSRYLTQQIHSTSFGLSSQMTLYQGGQMNQQIQQNKLVVDQNSQYVQEAKNSVTLSITEAYLTALYYKEAVKVAENNLEASQKEYEQAKGLTEAGSMARKDMLDAQSQVASNRYNIITAKNNLATQLLTLKQLLELQPQEDFQIKDPIEDETPIETIPSSYDVYSIALEQMPEIKAARMNLSIGEYDIKMARANYLPTLSLSGSLGTGYSNTQDYDFAQQMDLNFNQRLGLSLSIPIFNRFSTKTNVQKAQISLYKTQIQITTAEKTLYQKIQTAWQNAVSARDQLIAAEAASDAAKEAYDLAKQQFELGGISTLDLVTSQNTYTNAKQNYLQAKYMSIMYAQLLQFYQGNTISYE